MTELVDQVVAKLVASGQFREVTTPEQVQRRRLRLGHDIYRFPKSRPIVSEPEPVVTFDELRYAYAALFRSPEIEANGDGTFTYIWRARA